MYFTFKITTKGIILCMFLMVSIDLTFNFENDETNNSFSAYAQGNVSNIVTSAIPSAELIHTREGLELPSNVGAFVMLIVNEAHESW